MPPLIYARRKTMAEIRKSFYMTNEISSDMDADDRFRSEVCDCIARYNQNDWGDLCEDDKRENDLAIKEGGMVLGAYKTSRGKIYIITDDAGVVEQTVTILYPEEY